LVTPLRDGMNLVAKEYVAAQNPDDPGVLALSCFAGAADEFASALLVNLHDTTGVAEALQRSLSMPLAERKERHQANLAVLRKNNLGVWRDTFLADLRGVRIALPDSPDACGPPSADEANGKPPGPAKRC
jgi:trehalose 6-phosphate synthase